MFFHRFVRVGGRLIRKNVETALSAERFSLIPLICPDTPVGRALLNEDECAVLSAYSDSADSLVDIVYVDIAATDDYDKFVSAVFGKMAEALKVRPRDPCLLIAEPACEQFHAVTFLDDTDWASFKRFMFFLIEHLSSSTGRVDLPALIRRRQIQHFVYKHGHDLWTYLKEILHLIGRA